MGKDTELQKRIDRQQALHRERLAARERQQREAAKAVAKAEQERRDNPSDWM